MVRRSDSTTLERRPPGWREPWISEEQPLDAKHLAGLLVKERWLILAVAALVVVPALVATLLQPKLYRSTALLQIDPGPVQLLPNGNVETPKPAFDVYMRTQEQVLSGPTLLARVAARLGADSDPAAAGEVPHLYQRAAGTRLEATQMLTVTYLAPQPELAAKIANLFAEEFIKLQFDVQQRSRETARESLERDLRRVESQIQSSERELVAYSEKHEVEGARPDRRTLADTRLEALASQTLEAETGVASANARVEALQSASLANFPDALMTEVLRSRLSALLQLERELTALRTSFGENWPAVVQKRDEIAVVREQISREKNTVLEQARAQALLEQQTAEAKLRSIRLARTSQEGRVNQLQNASIQYNILQRNVETNRKLYEGLLERLKQLSVAPGMDLASARVIEPAIPDTVVARPKILWNLLLASVLGLALGVSVVFGRDYWTNSFSTVEQLEHVTMLPVLAAIPLLRQRTSRKLSSLASRIGLGKGDQESRETGTGLPAVSGVSPDRIFLATNPETAEAVRSLCASLLLSRSERPPKVVAVTSAVPGEGKTTITLELGRALAENGARTLLVEGDMRRPQLSHMLGVGMEGGLSLFLSGHTKNVKVNATSVERLFVVSAGPAAPNPLALLSSDKLNAFVTEMGARFQFVIIDTPPAIPVADARVVGAKADGIVMVIRAGHTSRLLLRRACTMLDQAGCGMLGAVINGVHRGDMHSSYYYAYDRDPARANG